jgi:hypothetical protein
MSSSTGRGQFPPFVREKDSGYSRDKLRVSLQPYSPAECAVRISALRAQGLDWKVIAAILSA